MNSTTTNLLQTLPKDVLTRFLDGIDEGTKMAYGWILSFVKQLIVQHWAILLGFLVLVLFVAFIEYLSTGSWKILGRVLYSYIYWGIVLLIALIFGSDIFASEWIKILLALVYGFSFWSVGKLLTKMGIHHH